MKKLIIYLIILSSFLFYFGCDKPAPTQLEDDISGDPVEIEVIGKELGDEYYSNGFDTSGVSQNIVDYANIISVAGVKVTKNGDTRNHSIASALFFDRNKPVYRSDGRLIGYQTIAPGIVSFDGTNALILNFRIRFRDRGVLVDTLLGKQYLLYNNHHGNLNQFVYRYNSSINFNLNPFIGQQVSFNIATPTEITGSVKLTGNRNDNNLNALLEWNSGQSGKLIIVLGVTQHGNEKVIPLYRMRTRDDGKLIVPKELLNKIPHNLFHRLTFTFIRRYESANQYPGGNLYVSSQSLHTIFVNIP